MNILGIVGILLGIAILMYFTLWLSLLVSHIGASNSQDQAVGQQAAERTSTKPEGKLVQVWLKMLLG